MVMDVRAGYQLIVVLAARLESIQFFTAEYETIFPNSALRKANILNYNSN